jgi:mannitol-specific phosphotransferase system IIBC component
MPRLKTMKNPLVVYTLARLGIFSAVLALLLLLNFAPIVAVVIATMLSFSFSLIFLRKQREASSAKLYEAINKPKKTVDENAEDEN